MTTLSLLGATGSIGVNTLNIVRQYPQRFKVAAMAAGKNVQLFARQIREFKPELVSVLDEVRAAELRSLIPEFKGEILHGSEGNRTVATYADSSLVLSAIVGAAGLLPTLAAIEAGKDIALANKETLVMAGRLVTEAVRRKGVALLPVDSEHSAIFQSLAAGRRKDLHKILLTASGGPFRGRSVAELADITPEQALAHPNWNMGPKVSIDSSTLMNKGLEVIEARWLFNVAAKDIEVLVHPQSIVHSAVEFRDGSIIAQLGVPDMRLPIAYALSCPERMELGMKRLSLTECGSLEFYKPDLKVFPALQLAFDAIAGGGVLPAVLNAANEVAVAAFLAGQLKYLQIAETVARTLDIVHSGREDELEAILAADSRARKEAAQIIESL
jgi:1-deoxy-D-xylulose-5-phosphate reductoisomerase